MKLPLEIKGRHKVRDGNICKSWIEYLDNDEDLRPTTKFKIALAEQIGLSYRYVNRILATNSVALKPNKQHESNKRYWKLKSLAKGKNESNKDIVDILECQRKEIEGDKPVIDQSQHKHYNKITINNEEFRSKPTKEKINLILGRA